MRILFLSLSGLTFNVTTPEVEPLGGTESSFCYLARELSKRGLDVTLTARNVPNETIFGVKHANECNAGDYDIVISNAPIQFTGDRKPYYIFWNHLAHFDNAIKSLMFPAVMAGIDCAVYVSEWQRNECEKQFGRAKKTVVIGNGLTPAFEDMFANVGELLAAKKPDRAVYTSTPYRGLRLLPEIMDAQKDMRLHVYSGLRVYQGSDVGYEGIYDALRERENIVYRGNVSQTQLASQLKQASYLFYPSTFPETYCIAVLEAMAAGLQVVTTNLGALPDTCAGFAVMAREENTSLDELLERYRAAIGYARLHWDAETMFKQSRWVNDNCTWSVRAESWVKLFGEACPIRST